MKITGGQKTEGFDGSSFPSAEVWFESTVQTIIYIQVYLWYDMVFCTITSPSLHKHKDDMVVLYCKCVGDGGLGSSPRHFLS